MVRECRLGTLAACVARVRSGWVILAEQQVTRGYCLLLPDPVVDHLNELMGAGREAFLSDMGILGDALLEATDAVRINYAIFGNVEPALHLHLFPRYADEPQSTRTLQPWALDWNSAPRFSESAHGDLKRRIAAGLAARLASS